MKLVVKGYQKKDALLSNCEKIDLFVEEEGAEPKTVEINYANILEDIWGLQGSNLFQSLYQIVREDISEMIKTGRVKAGEDIKPLVYDTYNLPSTPPKAEYLFPETIQQDPILFKGALEHFSGEPIKKEEKAKISCLGEVISSIRDEINSVTKIKWNFKLLIIEQERNIAYVYISCADKEEFTNRVASLRNLVTWLNKDGIRGMFEDVVPEGEGTKYYLEKFMEKEFSPAEKANVFGRFEDLQGILSDYMLQKDLKELEPKFTELGIATPKEGYFSSAWEGILYKYLIFLKSLLEALRKKTK